MSLDDESRAIMVAREMEKAQSTYNQACLMRENGYWDAAANRLYYAVFHATSALLIKDGYPVKTHHGAGMLFRQYYVKTNILPESFSDTFSLLQALREKSDYNCSFDATQGLINPLFAPTHQLIDTIAKMVTQQK
jgi:uncharacterized protein (UPF0332 family)